MSVVINDWSIIISVFVPIFVCYVTYVQNNYLKWHDSNRVKVSELQAIQSELRAIKRLIVVRRKEIVPSNPREILKYQFFTCFTSYNYWTVYEGISPRLGTFANQLIIGDVISTYTDIKALLEVVKETNKMAEYGFKISVEKPGSDEHKKCIDMHFFMLQNALTFSSEILTEIGNCELNLEEYISEILLHDNECGAFKFWYRYMIFRR